MLVLQVRMAPSMSLRRGRFHIGKSPLTSLHHRVLCMDRFSFSFSFSLLLASYVIIVVSSGPCATCRPSGENWDGGDGVNWHSVTFYWLTVLFSTLYVPKLNCSITGLGCIRSLVRREHDWSNVICVSFGGILYEFTSRPISSSNRTLLLLHQKRAWKRFFFF